MSTILNELTLEDAAREAAGNWKRFECFIWYRADEVVDPEAWAILYTHNRDSGLLSLSNANAIEKALDSFTGGEDPDVVFESHTYWLAGHVDGFSIRIYRDGAVTNAFTAYYELVERLSRYAVLDEQDYDRWVYEAALANIAEAALLLRHDNVLPDDWKRDVFCWLTQNRENSLLNRDDLGAYPSENDLRAAFEALGYPRDDLQRGRNQRTLRGTP